MKNILYTLALLISFSSFGQDDIVNASKTPMTLKEFTFKLFEEEIVEEKFCQLKKGFGNFDEPEGREIFELAGSWRAVFEARGYIFPLNNQSIIEMIKLGFKEQILIAKIETSDCDFNTSTKELKRLEELDVSTNVLVAMIKKPVNQVDQEWVKYDPMSDAMWGDKTILRDEEISKFLQKWREVAMELMPEEFNCIYRDDTELEFFYKEFYLKNHMRPDYEFWMISGEIQNWVKAQIDKDDGY